MAMRNDHMVMIEQSQLDGSNHWMIINLIDKSSIRNGLITGSWKHTKKTYNGEIEILSARPALLYWEWRASAKAQVGDIYLGARGNSQSSLKEGEGPPFDIHVILYHALRDEMDRFVPLTALDKGAGMLRHRIGAAGTEVHFMGGGINWTMVRYEK